MTVETHPRGFKIRTIIDCLAWDLLLILRDALAKDTLDSDHLKLRILMILSDVTERTEKTESESGSKYRQRFYTNSYTAKLLFRDYSVPNESNWHTFHLPENDEDCACTIKIHDEAITYLSSVLERRLALAQNLKHRPSNPHLLYETLSHFSTRHSTWQLARTNRHHNYQSAHEDRPYFSSVAQRLAEQRAKLATKFGAVSQRRRQQYGPIWLVVGDCVTEMPEELSLFNVFGALPLSLDAKFVGDPQLQKCFSRVLDSLNERYKLLRSCGLKPQIWLDRSGPSIAVLRELKQLRSEAEKLLKTGKVTTLHLSYHRAFNNKITSEKNLKYAGSTTFDELIQTEHGMAMLNYSTISLDQFTIMSSGNEELSLYDILPGTDFHENAIGTILERFDDDFEWVQYLIDSRPDLFDEVMTVFFHQAIGTCRPFDGEAKDRQLLNDPEFRALINSDPAYRNLSDDEMVERLVQQAERIIDRGLRGCINSNPFSNVTSEQDNGRQEIV